MLSGMNSWNRKPYVGRLFPPASNRGPMRCMNRRLVILASLSLLTACATTGRAPAPAPAAYEELEPVFAAIAGKSALTIRVSSNGCTKKEDFAFYVERRGSVVTVAFARKRLDTCASFAAGRTDIVFTYEELGLDPAVPFFLANPHRPWFGPAD